MTTILKEALVCLDKIGITVANIERPNYLDCLDKIGIIVANIE
jgi:hypothetical protein